MPEGDRFMALVEKVPVDNDKLIGQAVSWFINKQNPEMVTFDQYDNGYQIKVYTSEEDARSAREFWDEFVDQYL